MSLFRRGYGSCRWASRLLIATCDQCGYSRDHGQGLLTVPPDLRCDVIAMRRGAGESVESVPQHCQALAQCALLLLDGRDLALGLPASRDAVHGIDCLARLGHGVLIVAVVDFPDGLAQVETDASCCACMQW